MSWPSNRTVPPDGPGDARYRLQQRRLAGAVRAEQGDDLALADVEVDAEQHLHVAVAHVEAPHVEQVRRRGRPSGSTVVLRPGRPADSGSRSTSRGSFESVAESAIKLGTTRW